CLTLRWLVGTRQGDGSADHKCAEPKCAAHDPFLRFRTTLDLATGQLASFKAVRSDSLRRGGTAKRIRWVDHGNTRQYVVIRREACGRDGIFRHVALTAPLTATDVPECDGTV